MSKRRQSELAVLVGVQGAGKSTFVRRRLFDSHVRINLDMLGTRRREQVLVRACLEAGQSFVVDNTNPTVEDRRRYLPAARLAGFRVVAYHFVIDPDTAQRQNARRPAKRRIPAAALVRTARRLQPPTMEEGFDAVHFVTQAEDGRFIVDGERC
jgi:predicted kinase